MLCAAASLSLACSHRTALAAPSGDEYLPKVPESRAGSSRPAVRRDRFRPGRRGIGPRREHSSTGGDAGRERAAEAEEAGDRSRRRRRRQGRDAVGSLRRAAPATATPRAASFQPDRPADDRGRDRAAVGMTLRRRQADDEDPEAPGTRPGPSGAPRGGPPTPDGEIVAGRDKTARRDSMRRAALRHRDGTAHLPRLFRPGAARRPARASTA